MLNPNYSDFIRPPAKVFTQAAKEPMVRFGKEHSAALNASARNILGPVGKKIVPLASTKRKSIMFISTNKPSAAKTSNSVYIKSSTNMLDLDYDRLAGRKFLLENKTDEVGEPALLLTFR